MTMYLPIIIALILYFTGIPIAYALTAGTLYYFGFVDTTSKVYLLLQKFITSTQSFPFLASSNIPAVVNDPAFNGAKLTWGFPIAIAAVILCGLFMYRSRWGYSIRMIGINQDFARYSGMKVGKTIVLSQVIGGFLAGAGGGVEMLGRYSTFSWSALPGYGWTGITIAILAGNNPYMVPLAAFFMAYLSKGCDLMATYAKVPAQLIDIVQGVIFLFFAAEQFLSKYHQKLVVKSAEEELARANALKEG